jgi:DNA-binding NtrC family response regulator
MKQAISSRIKYSYPALEVEGGSVTRAAERLGLKRQTLSNMLKVRHKKLFNKRTPPTPRLKSIIKKDA